MKKYSSNGTKPDFDPDYHCYQGLHCQPRQYSPSHMISAENLGRSLPARCDWWGFTHKCLELCKKKPHHKNGLNLMICRPHKEEISLIKY